MKKKATQFTYTVSGQDGRDTTGLNLAQVKQQIAAGTITGATFIRRSDSEHWATAADFPELAVKDVVVGRYDHEGGPDALTQEMEEAGYARLIRTGAGWFFWIAALSGINAVLAFAGGRWRYALGLFICEPIAEVGILLGQKVALVAFLINLALVALYFFFGIAGWQKKFWPYVIGMGLYAGDAVGAFMAGDWLSAAIHVLALYFMYGGFTAHLTRRNLTFNLRLLIPAAVSVLLTAGASVFLDVRLHVEAKEPASREAWASKPTKDWPNLVLSHDAEFRGHSPLSGASAFLVELPDKTIVAVTAKHLLGRDGGVEPTLRADEINDATVNWQLHTRANLTNTISVTGLYGSANYYRSFDDSILLEVDESQSALPTTPLKLRFKPLERDEKIYVVGVRYDNPKEQQEAFQGRVRSASYGLIEASLETPVNLQGFSGAPILDSAGHVVGVVTGARSDPDKNGRWSSFAGHGTEEIGRILRAVALQ